jgi:molybdopterin converting factor small subunit
VAGIRAALLAALPQIEPLLSRSAIVVDGRYAAADETVEMTAEIAVIPPVSGG